MSGDYETLEINQPKISYFKKRSEAVSYTHLRAHETDSYLVCRLLLEKKSEDNTLWLDEMISKIEDMKNNIFDAA